MKGAIIFTEGMREFYRKNGVDLPKRMTRARFKQFLEGNKK